MFTRFSMRFLTSVPIALAFLLAGAGQVRAQFTFGEPGNLGPVVNSSSANDMGPSLSADGLTLFFFSDRPGGSGGWDLWMTSRASVSDPWEPPRNLGPTVNTSAVEVNPEISADGLTLYFNSDRPGGLGSQDVWITTRATPSDPWQSPVNLGPPINSASKDAQPSISTDELTLFFSSLRPGGFGDGDLWVTTRANASEPWGTPANLGILVNSSSGDTGPSISADELTLFFQSDRPGGACLERDLWMTTRSSISDPWASPIELPPPVNFPGGDSTPDISANEQMLFYTSSRPTNCSPWNLWQVTVIPDCPADLNGDGEVGPFDLASLLGNWGPCDDCPMDFNDDGVIGPIDLATLLGSWGPCPCNEC